MKTQSFIVAALSMVICAANLCAVEQMRSGEWRVVFKDSAPKCTVKPVTNEDWTGLEKKDGKQLISIYPPSTPSSEPIKFVIFFGDADGSGEWYSDESSVSDWWNCKGDGQWGWFLECAPDVRHIVDPNPDGKYRMWVCLELAEGVRVPWYGQSPRQDPLDDAMAGLNPAAVQLPKDYKWGSKTSHAGEPKGKPIKDGEFRVINKDQAPAFGGYVFAFEGWVWEPARVSKGPARISWPRHGKDANGGDVVKYLVYFADPKEGKGWYPNPAATKDWFECKGRGQWSWYLETAPNVTEVIDPNEGANYLAYVAVEYASGKRVPLYGDNNAKAESFTTGSERTERPLRLPKDYKWDGGSTPVAQPGKPVWQELGGAKRVTGELTPGTYRVLRRSDVPEWKGELWSSAKWRGAWASRRQSLISWPLAADDGDNKAVKFIILVSTEFKNSPNWMGDAQKVKAWFECKGENQQDWLIECAPDVTQILDLNRWASYYVWIAVEYSDGKRYPWFKDDFSNPNPKLESYDSGKANLVRDNCLKFYEDYEWDGQLRNAPDIESGKYRIVTKDNAPAWNGKLWTADRFYGKNKISNSKDMFSWPTCSDDEFGNKAVKFIIYFGKRDTQKKWHADSNLVKKWFGVQGQAKDDGAQYDWCIECATDVTQLVDLNKDSNYNFWVVVEYSNGKRSPFYGDNFPVQERFDEKKTRKNRIEISVTEAVPNK